jgi:hypothetical protein
VIGLPNKRRICINKRVTGVSVPPGFGIAWETVPDVEREVLLRLLPFLEDRRVLYDPTEVEIPNRCVESVLRLREFLVDLAGVLKEDAKLREILRSMAAACRAFLTRLPGPQSQEPLGSPGAGWGYPSLGFQSGSQRAARPDWHLPRGSGDGVRDKDRSSACRDSATASRSR